MVRCPAVTLTKQSPVRGVRVRRPFSCLPCCTHPASLLYPFLTWGPASVWRPIPIWCFLCVSVWLCLTPHPLPVGFSQLGSLKTFAYVYHLAWVFTSTMRRNSPCNLILASFPACHSSQPPYSMLTAPWFLLEPLFHVRTTLLHRNPLIIISHQTGMLNLKRTSESRAVWVAEAWESQLWGEYCE